MAHNIHPTAIISKEAKIGLNATIGPYSVINGPVVMGDDVTIGSHCVVEGLTTLGHRCQLYTGAVIGSPPQDKKHDSQDKVYLTVGDDNIFREYVTVNPGTIDGGGKTTIGDGNLFMACSHVAHDCHIGSHCVLANYVGLSGHVTLEDRVTIGGLTGVHQFVRLGYLSIVGGCSKATQDVPPYCMADGNPAVLRGLNVIGLKRANITSDISLSLRRATKILFNSGLARSNAITQVKEQFETVAEVKRLIDFVELSKRGIS